jgi:hypothetical protein
MEATGKKYDQGKPSLALLDRHALEEIARVMDYGATKYKRYNWRGGIHIMRLMNAALRHLFAFIDGEDFDPESGLSHLAHAQCCIMFAQRMMKDRPDLDDRYLEGLKKVSGMSDPTDIYQYYLEKYSKKEEKQVA